MRKILLNIIRVLISLGLIGYLIYISDVPEIFALMGSMKPVGIIVAFLTFLLSMVFLALRWHLLNTSYGINTPFIKLFKFYLIGLFFNNFLPTSIGGDLARAYYLARESQQKSASIGTVFLERVIGLLATLSLAFISLFWVMRYFHSRRIVYITLFIIIFISLFMMSIMSRRIYRRFNALLSFITFYNIGDRIIKVLDTLHYYRDKKKVLLGTYVYSLVAQFFLIVMNYVLARALELNNISFGYLILVVPITFVIGLLPSINGIGVRDTGYILLLSRLGLQPSQILSLSFSVTIIPIVVSLVGGVYFLVYRHKGIEAPILKEEQIS
jgi:uncharacterized protein (TIRG00374 family)